MRVRKTMVTRKSQISIRTQCSLLSVPRSQIYYDPKPKEDVFLTKEIADIYEENPVYGYRRMRESLRRDGYVVNSKRVLRIMRENGLKAIYPGPKTTLRNKGAYTYPYLLKGLSVSYPHQAWQVDITYLRTSSGFLYLSALIDVYTRKVVSWNISNDMDRTNCLRVLEWGIQEYGPPKIINSDQGSQFTSHDWVKALKTNGIQISMSGAGRSNDNAYIERLWRTLKYEYLKIRHPKTVADYKDLLPKFIRWYNHERPHQSLSYLTPNEMMERHNLDALGSLNLVS